LTAGRDYGLLATVLPSGYRLRTTRYWPSQPGFCPPLATGTRQEQV